MAQVKRKKIEAAGYFYFMCEIFGWFSINLLSVVEVGAELNSLEHFFAKKSKVKNKSTHILDIVSLEDY